MRVLAGLAAVVVLVVTALSVLTTLVVPRRTESRFAVAVMKSVRRPFTAVATRSSSYLFRDRLLAPVAPLALIVLLVSWLLAFLVGYGLAIFAVTHLTLGTALREAGSSLFTLGFASPDRTRLTALDFAAAMTGPVVIGLQIGYLPALYSAYNRRETEVTLLGARAGEPNWGPEILARHAMIRAVDTLPTLFTQWERWAAEVSESHTNYPVLLFFRSQEATRSWLVALVAVMDAAALQVSCAPEMAQGPARLALRMGFSCLRAIASTLRIPHDVDPDPDGPVALTREEFDAGLARMDAQGFPRTRPDDEAWVHFRGWRVNYEEIAYTLATIVEAVPAPWTGTRSGHLAPLPVVSPLNRVPGGGVTTPGSVLPTVTPPSAAAPGGSTTPE